MKINRILERQELHVKLLDHESTYMLMHTSNGLPYYIPGKKDTITFSDAWVDDSLFLPIEESDYENDHEKYHFGYRIRFVATGHSTLSLSSDPSISGVTTIEPSYGCSRVRYYIEKGKIIIDKFYDPLFPPRSYRITDETANISSRLSEFIEDIMTFLCDYYVDKRV